MHSLRLVARSIARDASRSARLLSALFVIHSATLLADESTQPDLGTQVDALFADCNRPDLPGCAVGIVRNGELIYSKGFGAANVEHQSPNTPQTVFETASMSKSFTCVALALLMDEGKISPDDDFRRFLPEMHAFNPPIRIRDMIGCRSGLWDPWHVMPLAGWDSEPLHSPYNREDVLTILFGQKRLPFEPGSQFHYASGEYVLLGLVVERVSGQTLAEFSRTHIFEPLGMTRSFIEEDPSRIVPGRATGYYREQGAWRQWRNNGYLPGGGGFNTCVEDLAAWDRNFDDNHLPRGKYLDEFLREGILLGNRAVLDADAYRRAAQPDVPNSPAGQYRGLKRIQFTGGVWGLAAAMSRYPEQRLTVICLSNSDDVSPFAKTREIAELFLSDQMEPLPDDGRAEAAAATVMLSAEQLQQLTGAYRSGDRSPIWRVEVRDGVLHVVDHLHQGWRLSPETVTRFRPEGQSPFYPSARFDFERASADAPYSMTLNSNEHGFHEVIAFVRVEAASPPADELAEYVGEYVSDELAATYRFRVRDGALWVRVNSRRWEQLDPTVRDQFTPHIRTGFDQRFWTFHRDAEGRVAGLTVSLHRVLGVEFVKRSAAQ